MSFLPFLFPTSGDDWREWLRDSAPELLTIIVVLTVVQLLLRMLVRRVFGRVVARAALARRQDPVLADRRTKALVATINWVVTVFVFFIGTAMVLDNLGMNVSALVASAGVAGLGLTFGAQQLVRDLINGTFILAENQYNVGDVVLIAGVSGEVLEVNPRRTVIRDADGNVHSVPNGAISVATNMTSGFSRINLDVTVDADADIDRAVEVIDDECALMAKDRAADFIQAPKVLRVEAVTELGVVLKVTGDVRPGTQWALTGELRRRLKERFDREGVALPRPVRAVVSDTRASKPPQSEGPFE